ncbi:MAG: hypothetical protein WBD04_06255, partial [Candidatus Omnitrophota bacterium]
MKKTSIVLLAGLMFLMASVATSYAGPWTLAQGKIWTEIFTRYTYSNHCFDSKGNLSRWEGNGFQEVWDLEAKVEYGLFDKFNVLLYVPYTWNTWKEDQVISGGKDELKNEGFKEIQIGGKYKFLDNPVVAAVQLKAFIDLNSDRNKEPKLSNYGNALELRGLVGKSFTLADWPCYASIESGIKFPQKRWGERSLYATTIPVFGEFGFSPHDRVMIKNEIDCSISVPGTGRVKDTYTWRIGPIFSLLGQGFSSIFRGDEYSLNLELQYGWTFAGRSDPD